MLRRIRSHPALWGEQGPEKELQAQRILARCKAKMAPEWEERKRQVEARRGHWMYAAEGFL